MISRRSSHERRRLVSRALVLLWSMLSLIKVKWSKPSPSFIKDQHLPSPDKAPWKQLYHTGDDEAFLAATSLTRSAFKDLLNEFSNHYTFQFGTKKGGRPKRLVQKHSVLGLVTRFYVEPLDLKGLSQLHGIPKSTASRTLKDGEIALGKALKALPDATIRYPTLYEQRVWAEAVSRKEPLVQGRWGYVDGKNFRVVKGKQCNVQNSNYNGWLHNTFVTGTLCFGADGTIAWGKHNCSGSWNDGDTSKPLQDKLSDPDKNLDGHGVASDSAFPVSKRAFGRILTPFKEGDIERAPRDQRHVLYALNNAITSIRQAAEWGMGAIEKPYRRLLQVFPGDKERRKLRLTNICKLYNFRVRRTGISQIRNVFFPDGYNL